MLNSRGPNIEPCGTRIVILSHSLNVLFVLTLKENTKMQMYRDYKTFNIDFFKRDLRESLENHTSYDYSCFQNIFIALLNKHAPIKKKIIRFNNNPFMSKALRKAIMHRSKFKNIYNKYRTEDNWAN